jgi:FkbM family methyltransferase
MTLKSWTRTSGWQAAVRWHLSRPFRALASVRSLPRVRYVSARIAWRLAGKTIRPGSAVLAETPGGGSVAFAAETLIGRTLWTVGAFEQSELCAASRLCEPSTYAVDVGANVGLFTVAMSRAVGPTGRVVAIEPVADTVGELRRNLERGGCMNVDIVQGAAAAAPGDVPMMMTDDPALHSAGGTLLTGHSIGEMSVAKAFTLDEIWIAAGRPRVSMIKVDVEGGEHAVLLGAAQLIEQSRPALLVEVNDPLHLSRIAELLPGYREEHTRGFEPWNHLMVHGG